MFWIGLLMGLFVGMTIGVVGLAMLMMNGSVDESRSVAAAGRSNQEA